MAENLIVRRVVHRYAGKDHDTYAKAKDAAESAVHEAIKQALLEQGFTANECYKATIALLPIRHRLMQLLNFSDKEPINDDDG